MMVIHWTKYTRKYPKENHSFVKTVAKKLASKEIQIKLGVLSRDYRSGGSIGNRIYGPLTERNYK
jgi:hypothetical protein